MTNQNQTFPNYEVHCSNCGWWGWKAQLKTTYVSVADDVSSGPGCPQCLAGSLWLEDKEDDSPYPSSRAIAGDPSSLDVALRHMIVAGREFNQAMENLHCEISRQQS